MSEIRALIGDSGYEYKELADDVYILYNFLTEEERGTYHRFATDANEVDWTVSYLKALEDQAVDKYNRTDIATLIEEGLLHVNPSWIDKALRTEPLSPMPEQIAARAQMLIPQDKYSVNEFDVIQRHYFGTKLTEHIDSEHDSNLKYAAVAYLNDDYEGGELYFPRFELKIKPPAKSLVIFSADYLHGVSNVNEGPTRYVAPVFIFNKKQND